MCEKAGPESESAGDELVTGLQDAVGALIMKVKHSLHPAPLPIPLHSTPPPTPPLPNRNPPYPRPPAHHRHESHPPPTQPSTRRLHGCPHSHLTRTTSPPAQAPPTTHAATRTGHLHGCRHTAHSTHYWHENHPPPTHHPHATRKATRTLSAQKPATTRHLHRATPLLYLSHPTRLHTRPISIPPIPTPPYPTIDHYTTSHYTPHATPTPTSKSQILSEEILKAAEGSNQQWNALWFKRNGKSAMAQDKGVGRHALPGPLLYPIPPYPIPSHHAPFHPILS